MIVLLSGCTYTCLLWGPCAPALGARAVRVVRCAHSAFRAPLDMHHVIK